MPFFTLPGRLAASFAGLLLTATSAAVAQPTVAPPWTSVRAVGAGANMATGTTVVAADAEGNLYQAGTFSNTTTVGGVTLVSQGGPDGFLAKYTADGTVLWVRQLGSAGADGAAAVVVDAAGNAYVMGAFVGNIDLGSGLALSSRGTTQSKTFCIRYSPQGAPQWVQQSNDFNYSAGSGLALDASGHLYLTGAMTGYFVLGTTPLTSPDNFTSNTAYLARLNAATGQVETLRAAFSYGPNDYRLPLLAATPAGRVYLLPHFTVGLQLPGGGTLGSLGQLDAAVLCYAPDGRLEWARQLGSPQPDDVRQAAADAAGNLYVVGHSQGSVRAGLFTLPNNGSSDGFLLKYDPTGEVQWAQTVNSPDDDRLLALTLGPGGAPYVTGYFSKTITVGSQKLTSSGQSDVLVAAYSPEGQVRWTQQAGGPGPDYGTGLGLGPNGAVQVLGSYSSPAAFGQLTLSTPAAGSFVALLGATVLGTPAARPLALLLAPNPANGRVRLRGLPAGRPVEVFDGLGRRVRTALLAPDASFSVRGLTPGLYVVQTTDALGQPYAGRLAVE
ncbi:hypothetical protein [Hymenobacter actinosclerus]|uniref:Por secretion system C-terminal sorting domain-containing protein n=1 Tax=Hymenobacter actinosclerus TaxID=82805 RepID=A0A1H9ZI49_9BACT|nr:hypothetical protein [Hymenobacter actinosclerus]SES81353.1 Por secretion system C-terminal sorting domain-containing protein [Hymenobacter actinosclerus]